MCVRSDFGIDVNIPGGLATDKKLFSESPGFVLEVHAGDLDTISNIFSDFDVNAEVIGQVTDEDTVSINGVAWQRKALQVAWRNGLREQVG